MMLTRRVLLASPSSSSLFPSLLSSSSSNLCTPSTLQLWRRLKSTTYFLTVPEKENFLLEELKHVFPSGFAGRSAAGLIKTNLSVDHPMPPLAFAKQVIPSTMILTKQGSNASWAKETGRYIIKNFEGFTGPWRLHIITPTAPISPGHGRGQIYKEIFSYLRQKKASLLRTYNPVSHAPFKENEALVQLVFTKNKVAVISIMSPQTRKNLEKVVSHFPAGTVKVFRDKSNPPSMAYTKLLEAEHRMGYKIGKDQTVVDLGGSPGSWTRVALFRGATVTSVDWAKLHPKVMDMRGLKFIEGDAFTYVPKAPVDWLICDVANFPEKTMNLMREWLVKQRLCKFFVITLKFKIGADHKVLAEVKKLMSKSKANYKLTCLENNGNEVTCYGYFPDLVHDVAKTEIDENAEEVCVNPNVATEEGKESGEGEKEGEEREGVMRGSESNRLSALRKKNKEEVIKKKREEPVYEEFTVEEYDPDEEAAQLEKETKTEEGEKEEEGGQKGEVDVVEEVEEKEAEEVEKVEEEGKKEKEVEEKVEEKVEEEGKKERRGGKEKSGPQVAIKLDEKPDREIKYVAKSKKSKK